MLIGACRIADSLRGTFCTAIAQGPGHPSALIAIIACMSLPRDGMHVHAALGACHQSVPLRAEDSLRASHLKTSITITFATCL